MFIFAYIVWPEWTMLMPEWTCFFSRLNYVNFRNEQCFFLSESTMTIPEWTMSNSRVNNIFARMNSINFRNEQCFFHWTDNEQWTMTIPESTMFSLQNEQWQFQSEQCFITMAIPECTVFISMNRTKKVFFSKMNNVLVTRINKVKIQQNDKQWQFQNEQCLFSSTNSPEWTMLISWVNNVFSLECTVLTLSYP